MNNHTLNKDEQLNNELLLEHAEENNLCDLLKIPIPQAHFEEITLQ